MSNHFEGLGKTWLTLLNDPEKEVPAVVMQVMKEGKTRDCWQRKDSKEETCRDFVENYGEENC